MQFSNMLHRFSKLLCIFTHKLQSKRSNNTGAIYLLLFTAWEREILGAKKMYSADMPAEGMALLCLFFRAQLAG
jgi:hypothetical protein